MAGGQGGLFSSFELWQATLFPVPQLPGVIVVYLAAALALALGGATSNTSLVAKLLVLTPE